jgi:glucose-1-phosphate thymidylyltransferase
MKGIIMAGGSGSRLWPLTSILSKQILPVFDKPLIYYPISTLMSIGINELLIVSTTEDIPVIRELLGNGSNFGISIDYCVQQDPKGIAHGLILAEDFIDRENFSLILGDNIFYGQEFNQQLLNMNLILGATAFAYRVNNPTRYGVVELDSNFLPVSIEEKPKQPKSDLALTGLYFFDYTASKIAHTLKPSARGELEITDVLSAYMKNDDLQIRVIPSGTAWLDAGTPSSLHDASTFVRIIEERQGIKIACPEEIALRKGWLNKSEVLKLAQLKPSSAYADYLVRVANSL